ncbi:MAG: type II toxin-antitoxin system Phd/YefM family antitoxin [Gammaproteobacteria bacterium]
MRSLTIGELKTHFSEVLEQVRQGETFAISYGRKKEKVAALIPYQELTLRTRRLGVLEGRAQCYFKEDFSLSDEQLLES